MAAPTDFRVGRDAELADLRVRSHLSDGRVVAWAGRICPGDRIAIDAELDRPVPAALAARYGSDRFWERWTRLECVAKLTGTPVVRLLSRLDDEPPAGIALTTLRLDGEIVVSVGHRYG